jgi:hypothetical protein
MDHEHLRRFAREWSVVAIGNGELGERLALVELERAKRGVLKPPRAEGEVGAAT